MDKVTSLKLRYSYDIAAVLILVMHCSGNLPVRSNWTYTVCRLIATLGQIGVPWFVFMAGYFLFRSYNGDYTGLLKKKVKTLIVPYLVWNIIGYLFRLYIFNSIFRVEETISLGGFFKCFIPFRSANGALWTVSLLFLYMLMTPIIDLIIRYKFSLYSFIILAVIVMMLGIEPSTNNAIILYSPLYMTGGYMAIQFKEEFEVFIRSNRRDRTCNTECFNSTKQQDGTGRNEMIIHLCVIGIIIGVTIILY